MSLENYGKFEAAAAAVLFLGGGALVVAGCSVSGVRSLNYPQSVANHVAEDGFTDFHPYGNPLASQQLDFANFGDCKINFKSIEVVDNEEYLFKAKDFANFFAGRSALDVKNYAVVIPGQATAMTHTVQNSAELQEYVQANNITSLASCIPKTITVPATAG